ncbi:MAG: acetate--CoA ligase [Bacillales bacterium]|nr:acetate--CoA ligase [Bacillales bacterium]
MAEQLQASNDRHNLIDYQKEYSNFDWKDVEKEFSWYITGKVNIAYEAIDRHVKNGLGNKIALYYKDLQRNENFTYKDLMLASNKAANILKAKTKVNKGDRVFIFMPRTPELYFCFLGALKVGAIVGPLFEAFMEAAVKDRLEDSEAKVLITTSELLKRVPVGDFKHLESIIIVDGEMPEDNNGKNYLDFKKEYADARDSFDIVWVDREDGMLLHYTSGSTGKPKGVLHVHNAMIQHYQTSKWVLDLNYSDVFWCTADPGWVTGTSYGIFGPWLNKATNVVIGGRFSPDEWYKALENFGVTVWYSAPTAFAISVVLASH